MNQPFLSIAVPTFNRAKKLESQLSSLHKILLNSRFSSNIELVVVDNCSTDSTQDCIKHFNNLEREYIFLSYKNEMNIGAERNFGQGILRSQGEFTWLLSDDDTVHEDAIDHIYESLYNNQEVGFCFVNFDLDPTIGFPAIKVNNKDMITRNVGEYISATMFADSMISACIYRKALLTEIALTTMKEGPYEYMYWTLDVLRNHPALIIQTPLFSVHHPGVQESRENASKRENNLDFYLEAHLDFLKYTSCIYDFSLDLRLRLRIYRLTLNENLNQTIHHKITTSGLGYNFAALQLALPVMIGKFYFSPSFWLVHLPLLLLPSYIVRFFEPLRWKYLDFRAFLGSVIKKFYNLLK
ncbi:glycosyltransferase [Gammaproteobacteria bacterium]|jgi:glycosyltransferase involved in cell wall biosynthesis|nr:glycosyltransferase [Gammaproteobacteria bacterium]